MDLGEEVRAGEARVWESNDDIQLRERVEPNDKPVGGGLRDRDRCIETSEVDRGRGGDGGGDILLFGASCDDCAILDGDTVSFSEVGVRRSIRGGSSLEEVGIFEPTCLGDSCLGWGVDDEDNSSSQRKGSSSLPRKSPNSRFSFSSVRCFACSVN